MSRNGGEGESRNPIQSEKRASSMRERFSAPCLLAAHSLVGLTDFILSLKD